MEQWGYSFPFPHEHPCRRKKTKKRLPEGCMKTDDRDHSLCYDYGSKNVGGQLCIFCPQNFLTPFDRIIFFIVLLSQLPCIEVKMEITHSDINIPKECNRRGRTEVYEEISSGQAQTAG